MGGTLPCISEHVGIDLVSPPDHQSLKSEVKMLSVFPRNEVIGGLTLSLLSVSLGSTQIS